MDIKWFFMNIDKQILFERIKAFLTRHESKLNVDFDFLIHLLHQTIFHDSTKNCIIKGSKEDWVWLPEDKSLFCSSFNIGLAIWNLTSQLFANIYLDGLDKYIVHDLWFRYYGRYVDDFILIHPSKEILLKTIPEIKTHLSEKLHLTLHPKKIYLQEVKKGVLFLWTYIKPYRSYIHKRTVGKFYKKIQQINTMTDKEKIQSVINSYLWLLAHHKSYHIARRLFSKCNNFIRNIFKPVHYFKKISPYTRKLKSSEVKKLYPQWYYNGNLR